MTDLHTHILPGMDDGAKTVEDALALLRLQQKQGVDTVALTPHYDRQNEEIPDFLARRESAWELLSNKTAGQHFPKMILGAEVCWMPGIAQWPGLEKLCYQGTRLLLVELPFRQWNDETFHQLYSLENCRGLLPMIAHVDRYLPFQNKAHLEQLLDMGYPIQVSAGALFHSFARKWALDLLQDNDAVLISDCHNLTKRKPNMGDGMMIVEKKLGDAFAREIAALTDEILTY